MATRVLSICQYYSVLSQKESASAHVRKSRFPPLFSLQIFSTEEIIELLNLSDRDALSVQTLLSFIEYLILCENIFVVPPCTHLHQLLF